MDGTDLAIVRSLGLVPYAGAPKGPDAVRAAAVARRLGLGLDLVKDRLARMERAGIIRGYEVYPNLHHFGLEDVTFHADLPRETKERLRKDALLLDGVVGIYDYVGGHMCMQVLYRSRSDLDRKVRLLMALAGLDAPPAIYMQRRLPPVSHKLTNLDWRILKALRGRAKRPLAEVAVELGVSQRTVRRRVDRMTDAGDLDTVADFDFGVIPGVIPAEFVVFCPAAAADEVYAQLLHRLRDDYVLSDRPPSRELGAANVLCFAFSPGEIEAMRAGIETIPGVDRVEAWLPSGGDYSGTWLDEAIDAMVEQTAPMRSRATAHAAPAVAEVAPGVPRPKQPTG